MTKITDISAFVFANPDYWLEFLGGGEYPPGLTPEETTAVEAARSHVERQVTELLHLCGTKLPIACPAVPTQGFKGLSTAKNRLVTLPAPDVTAARLYRLEFALDLNDAENAVVLYSSIVVKKGSMATIRTALTAAGTAHDVDDYHIYGAPLSLPKDATFDALADAAVATMRALLAAL